MDPPAKHAKQKQISLKKFHSKKFTQQISLKKFHYFFSSLLSLPSCLVKSVTTVTTVTNVTTVTTVTTVTSVTTVTTFTTFAEVDG